MLDKTDSHMHDNFDCLDVPSLHAPPSLSSGKGALPSGRNPQPYSNVLELSLSSMLSGAEVALQLVIIQTELALQQQQQQHCLYPRIWLA